MASPAKGAMDLLVGVGVGVDGDAGWAIKVGRAPTSPDTLISIYDTPGEAPNPKWLLSFPHFQVQVRGAIDDYAGAYQKAKDVQDVLLGMKSQAVNGDQWDGIVGVGDIAFLKFDENNRPLFAVNFKVFLEPATNALTQRQPL